MSSAGRAQYDVLRIMRKLASGDTDDRAQTSPRKKGRPTTPQSYHPDLLTSDDILQEKYQELGKLLASQYVERKALSVLETTLLGSGPKRKKTRPASAKKGNKNGGRRKKERPSSGYAFSHQSDESPWWYDSDNTDYTETSATSSAKRVSFADDVVSFSGESSVVITELTEDDTEFEERIKTKPRVTLEEEEIEAHEMASSRDKRDIEQELMRSILRSPRPSSGRGYTSPTRSATPTTPRRHKSPKRSSQDDKQSGNLNTTPRDESAYSDDSDDDDENREKHEPKIEEIVADSDDEIKERKSRKKSSRKDGTNEQQLRERTVSLRERVREVDQSRLRKRNQKVLGKTKVQKKNNRMFP